MRLRGRVIAFWAALVTLAGAGAYFALIHEPRLGWDGESTHGAVVRPAFPAGMGVHGLTSELRRKHEMATGRRIRSTAHAEHATRLRELRGLALDEAAAEPIARRFFDAFARYELGVLAPRIEADLHATATDGFAGELIAAPPRVSRHARRLGRAKLGPLEFVPGKTAVGRGGLRTAELVGMVDRDRLRSPIAIGLIREHGDWRVAGISR